MAQPVKNMLHVRHVHNPSELILIAECNCWLNVQVKTSKYQYCWIKGYNYQTINNGSVAAGPPYTHYGKKPGDGKMNYLFCDGHVELMFPKDTTVGRGLWQRQ
jgi:prepilin-type processing-associated H-X9-DG protein